MKIMVNKGEFKDLIQREWIIANGIGGFAASTVTGANTRKYHGLLVAALTPPARRFLVLSKVDESIEFNGCKYPLYTNICDNYISDGYKRIESFEKKYVPTYTYKIDDISIQKTISMQYGRNTVVILYNIKNGNYDSKLTLAPIINYRDFHQVNKDTEFNLKEKISGTKVRIVVKNESQTPFYMKCSEGTYIEHHNDIFYRMFYMEEEKRGFDPIENHAIPGRYEIELKPNEEKNISFVFSLEENIDEIKAEDVIKQEEVRLKKIVTDTGLINENTEDKELIEDFIITTDSFIAYRPSFGLHTIIAGYPWFLDWGRDSLIAFEGLLLKTKRFDIAKEVLLTFIRDIKYGLVPNGYSGYDNRPLYNSVDASLLLFETVQKYINYTGDYQFIKEEIYKKLEDIIENYIKGIDVDNNNIYLDDDDLIVSGTQDTQNTWMDAKYDGVAITPRSGKAVEVNSLWYNANKIMADLSKKFGHSQNAKKYKLIAEKCKKSFNDKFYNKRRKCLYDVLGDSKIRPNQLFALSLTYPVIEADSEEAKNIISVVEKKLLNAYGLKTLAKGEENYVEVYEGDGKKRDSSYHQGITWPWLLGLYYNALKNILKKTKKKDAKKELETKLEKFIEKTSKTFQKEISHNGCIGSISELYDSRKPYLPKGTIAQAWSVAEVFRIILNK